MKFEFSIFVLVNRTKQMIQAILDFFEKQTFGVCAWLGDKLRLKTVQIRLFFIYASFLTLGSPLIVYLHMAFILRIKEFIQSNRSRVWDL